MSWREYVINSTTQASGEGEKGEKELHADQQVLHFLHFPPGLTPENLFQENDLAELLRLCPNEIDFFPALQRWLEVFGNAGVFVDSLNEQAERYWQSKH